MNYKRITSDIFLPETSTPEPVVLSELKSRISTLEAAIQDEPSDYDLIEWAKASHPYFSDRFKIESEIFQLQTLVQNLESIQDGN